MKIFEGKRVLVTGGTGSLGKCLVGRLLKGEDGLPAKIIVLSRDEAKQHEMRVAYLNRRAPTDEVIFRNFQQRLEFRIGDIRDPGVVAGALFSADIVINAAALKQVPTCEYFPYEAVRTNVVGAENIVAALERHRIPVEIVVGVSTDKACKPVNAMGLTKALQERIFIQGNLRVPGTRFVCVRYGNVLASRGSVIPLFHEQIRSGGPVTITSEGMTRFLLSLDDAVDTVFDVIRHARRGETWIPRAPSARIVDVARALVGSRPIPLAVTGIRPGEKLHEILISEEEAPRTVKRGSWFALRSMLPELGEDDSEPAAFTSDYSSATEPMSFDETRALLEDKKLMPDQILEEAGELLR
ncbi:MAG TPA: polysaccharide biosynthesis protein [Thermoanaerobaculia bacterium]|nr:polysaccharide biosynthesis protein [Thermoanaerobaculia bacterium]